MQRFRLSSLAVFVSSMCLYTLAAPSGRSVVRAQATASVQEPEYVGNFALLGADGKLTPLEKEKMTMQSKTKNRFISVSSSSEQVVPNANSTVRATPASHFVVRVGPGTETMDPSTLVAMKPFVVEKDQRAMPITTAKAGMFQGVKSQQAGDTSIPLTFKKYGQSSLEIVPAQPLPPGEYALATNSGVMGVFCFGVDAK